MRSFFKSFRGIICNYYWAILLYFFFFAANGGMEYNIPFFLKDRGISDSIYGVFISFVNVVEVVIPLVIVFLTKRYGPVKVNNIFLILGIFISVILCFISGEGFVFGGLLVIYCTRPIFNYSIGNSVNLSIPSKERSEYFAVRDVFLYGGIAISTFLSSYIIQKVGMDFLYGILSVGFVITIFLSIKIGRKGNIKQEIQEKILLKDYLNELKIIIKNKFYWVLLLFEIASVVYAIVLKFIPLLALQRKVELSSFLNYTAVFTIINCIGSFILAYVAKRAQRKKIYLFDVGFDIISVCLFLVTGSVNFFLFGYCISLLKDMFAPISFGYLYDCIEWKNGSKNAPIVLGLLDAISNIVSISLPIVIGIFWEMYFYIILLGCGVLFAITVGIGLFFLPKDSCFQQ